MGRFVCTLYVLFVSGVSRMDTSGGVYCTSGNSGVRGKRQDRQEDTQSLSNLTSQRVLRPIRILL